MASGTPGKQVKVSPAGDVAAFRQLFVEHAVAVKEDGLSSREKTVCQPGRVGCERQPPRYDNKHHAHG